MTGWNILDKPLQTSKKWEKILENKDKEGVVEILKELMSIAVAACKSGNITAKSFKEFFKMYNQLESFKVKCEDYDEQWSFADGIKFLKNLVYDIQRLYDNEEFRGIISNLVIFVGVFLWLQRGVDVKDIADQEIGSSDEEQEESQESEESDDDSIDDDLPYFGSSSKKEDKKARRKLVKRSKTSKQESDDSEGDEYETNLSQARDMLTMAVQQIKEQKLNENDSTLFAMSTFLAFLSYFKLDANYLKNFSKLEKLAEELKKQGLE